MCFCGRHNRQEGQFLIKTAIAVAGLYYSEGTMASTNRKGVFQLTKYVVKRILLAIVTILIVCGITFFAMNAIPDLSMVRRQYPRRLKQLWKKGTIWISPYLNNL